MPRAKVRARVEARRDAKARARWVRLLQAMVDGYRRRNPHDGRADDELADELMQRFVRAGLIKQDAQAFLLQLRLGY
jgi:hypothetical protein